MCFKLYKNPIFLIPKSKSNIQKYPTVYSCIKIRPNKIEIDECVPRTKTKMAVAQLFVQPRRIEPCGLCYRGWHSAISGIWNIMASWRKKRRFDSRRDYFATRTAARRCSRIAVQRGSSLKRARCSITSNGTKSSDIERTTLDSDIS